MDIGVLKERFHKNKKMVGDFGYNILATAIATIVLQLVVYPYLAAGFSAEVYGQLLTIMGIANIFLVSFGGGLNNVRLIQKTSYNQQNLEGDYNILLVVFTVISTIIFGCITGTEIGGISLILLLGYVVLGIIQNYWVVSYRIVIDYKANLIYNIFVSVGYVAGLVLTRFTKYWPAAFLLGQIFGIVYLLKSTALYREKYRITPLFSKTLKAYLVLIVTNLIANVVIYLDRIFLYPVMGGDQVTVYTVSSFVGKSIGLVVTPVAGVLLSYYAQDSFRMTLKKYWTINGIILVGGGMAGAVAILLAPWATGLLYPTVVDSTRQYIVIANVASLIGVLANILAPSVLKFANIFWQIFIQTVYAAAYIGLGYFFMKDAGLMGFCAATLLVNLIRMLLLMIIGHFSILVREKKE